MLTVGALKHADLDDAYALSAGEGWNQTVADWRRLTRLDSGGCVAARDGGRVVGTVTVVTYGQALGWVGMMIVHPDYRRQGIGATLMHRALDCARDRGVATVKLDATPAGRPLYESLGFTAETVLERWEGLARPVASGIPLLASDASAIAALDTHAYGADRSRVLDELIRDSVGGPLVARSGAQAVGYALARRGRAARYIGPIIATVANAATDLLHATLDRFANAPVCLDRHVGGLLDSSALETQGLTRRRTLLRMRLGSGNTAGTPPCVCASAGPELG